MSIHELDKKTMDALQTLADTNVKISEAKASLLAIQQSETTYLEEREKKAIAKINDILDASDGIIKKIHSNHHEVTQFYNTVSSYVSFIAEIQEKLDLLIGEFNKQSDLWNKKTKEQEKKLGEIQKTLEIQQKNIETDKKSLERQKKSIEKEKLLIESRQAQIANALQVLAKKQQ